MSPAPAKSATDSASAARAPPVPLCASRRRPAMLAVCPAGRARLGPTRTLGIPALRAGTPVRTQQEDKDSGTATEPSRALEPEQPVAQAAAAAPASLPGLKGEGGTPAGRSPAPCRRLPSALPSC